jgi:hypothetical protein
MSDMNEPGALANASDIIERFGGIRPMAGKMAVPVTTVQGWKKRNVIPENRREDVIRAAKLHNIEIADLVEKGGANQNVLPASASSAAPYVPHARDEDSFASEMQHADVDDSEPPSIASVHEARAHAASRPNREDIAIQIAEAEGRAVRRSVTVTVLLLLATSAMAVGVLWPYNQKLDGTAARVTTIEGRVSSHDKRLGLLEQGRTAVTAVLPEEVTSQIGALKDQLTAVQGAMSQVQSAAGFDAAPLMARIDALESKVAGSAASDGLALLADRMTQWKDSQDGRQILAGAARSLQAVLAGNPSNPDAALATAQQQSDALGQALKGVAAGDLKSAATLIALTQLGASVDNTSPFDEDLKLIQAIAGDRVDAELKTAIDALTPVSQQGVFNQTSLKDQLANIGPQIVEASLKGNDVTLKEKTLARLNELVQVHKSGELLNGTDVQSKVARAQKNLEDGDIAKAVAELQTLDGNAATTAKSFIDSANATIMARQAATLIISKLAPGAPNTVPAAQPVVMPQAEAPVSAQPAP